MACKFKPATPGVVAADSTAFAANLVGINSDFASKVSTVCGNEADTALEL